jgi:hypothetical protein
VDTIRKLLYDMETIRIFLIEVLKFGFFMLFLNLFIFSGTGV